MKNKNAKSEKCSVVNSNVEGGFTKKRKKAFTLIELLAIIVILAIIAVITVPIILNIIENSRKGAATDSAYGYKDSVNKWYVSELSNPNNQNFNLSSSYTVENGKIIDDSVQNDTGVLIPFSGDKPSSGELHYSNNVFKGGCLVFGDYAVTFETDGTTSTEKGDCSEYVFTDSNLPTVASCPGCVFTVNTIDEEVNIASDIITNYERDYTKLGHNIFSGYVLNPETHKINQAFACIIDGTEPLCIEGTTDNTKIQAIKTFLDSNYTVDAEGETENSRLYHISDRYLGYVFSGSDAGYVYVADDYDDEIYTCTVSPKSGTASCYSS